MTVTAVRKDPERLTLTVEAEFDASVERIWQLWADPRQLENALLGADRAADDVAARVISEGSEQRAEVGRRERH